MSFLFIMNCPKCKDSGIVPQAYLGLTAYQFCLCKEGVRLFQRISKIIKALNSRPIDDSAVAS